MDYNHDDCIISVNRITVGGTQISNILVTKNGYEELFETHEGYPSMYETRVVTDLRETLEKLLRWGDRVFYHRYTRYLLDSELLAILDNAYPLWPCGVCGHGVPPWHEEEWVQTKRMK